MTSLPAPAPLRDGEGRLQPSRQAMWLFPHCAIASVHHHDRNKLIGVCSIGAACLTQGSFQVPANTMYPSCGVPHAELTGILYVCFALVVHVHRSCILKGFTIDMVGFTEALNITGVSTTVKPILQDLVVLCSGDDGISVGGKAQPLIRSCDLRVSLGGSGHMSGCNDVVASMG